MPDLFRWHKRGRSAPHSNMAHSPYLLYLNSLAPSGRRAMATLLNQCALILGHQGPVEHYPWASLNYEKVLSVRTALMEAGYAVNTVNMAIAALRGIASTAFNLRKLSGDDMLRIKAIRPLKGRTASRKGRCLSRDELKQLIAICRQQSSATKQSRDKALLLVGVGAGLRCAEICALRREDIDLKTEKLVVQEGKGRKQRQLYLAPEVISALRDWIACRGNQTGALFSRILKDGTVTEMPLTNSGLTHALNILQETAGVAPFSPHDLRRTFITQLLEQGVDINTVRQLAGHSDVSTTVRYDKRDEAWQKQASQSIRL